MGFDKGQSGVAGRFPQVGAIFMCNRATKKECFRRELFGLPSGKEDFVVRVKAGMILFLFEYERRELYGVFQACSDGAMDIVPHAYSDSGSHFSAQVKFTTILRCRPLSEAEFSGAIRDNYFSPNKFNFGLSERQVENLLLLFSSRKLERQLRHRQSPQNNVRRSSISKYVGAPPEQAIDDGYRNRGMERYEQNVVPSSRSVHSPDYSENTTNFIRRAMDEYASTTIGNDRRSNGRSHVPVTPIDNVGDLIGSNNVAVERLVHQGDWRSTVGNLRNETNADFVHRLDGRSRYSEPMLATEGRTDFRTTGYDPPISSEQQPGALRYPSPPVRGSTSIYKQNSFVGDDLQRTSTDRRTGSTRAPGYDPPISSEQQPGAFHYPSPPVRGSASIYKQNSFVGDDLHRTSTDRRTGSTRAPGYDPPVSSEQQPGVPQYPNPPVYGSNSIPETNSFAGDDLQHSSIMHRSPADPIYLPLPPYSAVSDLEAMPRPSLNFDGPYAAASSRLRTGSIISTQPYNPDAPSYSDTNHSSPRQRVSSSFADESLPTLNSDAYRPSYENELLRPYRQLRDDSSLLPRYAPSNLSRDNNEDSYRSNRLNHSSLSSEFFFPRPSLPQLPLLSENRTGHTTTAEERSVLAPRVFNTPSVSGSRHLVRTPLEGNIPQSGSAHDEVPCNRNSNPNSERTHDSRRSNSGAYSPLDPYSGRDSERMHADQQNRNKGSVFDRVVFPTTQERERGSTTDFVGVDDDDNKDDFTVSEIMTSLRQSKYQWLKEKKPPEFLNGRHNNDAQYLVGNKKRQIRPWESKSADDHLAAAVVPVEDEDDALMKKEESPPFVDFKRRSNKVHQVEAAHATGNDNVVSAGNEQPKRRKLIRPKFGDGT